MKKNGKVIVLSVAKRLTYLDELNIRHAEEIRLKHIEKLQKNPPSVDLLKLAQTTSATDAFEREFDIFITHSEADEKTK